MNWIAELVAKWREEARIGREGLSSPFFAGEAYASATATILRAERDAEELERAGADHLEAVPDEPLYGQSHLKCNGADHLFPRYVDVRCQYGASSRPAEVSSGSAVQTPPTEKEGNDMTYYGPHACETCGQTIVKQAREEGGAAFDPPPLLMRIFQRGSEAGNPEVAYPMTWTPHVCSARNRLDPMTPPAPTE